MGDSAPKPAGGTACQSGAGHSQSVTAQSQTQAQRERVRMTIEELVRDMGERRRIDSREGTVGGHIGAALFGPGRTERPADAVEIAVSNPADKQPLQDASPFPVIFHQAPESGPSEDSIEIVSGGVEAAPPVPA